MKYLSIITSKLKRELTDKSNNQKKNLLRLKRLLLKKENYLIKSLCKDVGKSYADAKIEFDESIKIWTYAIKKLNKVKKIENFKISNKKKGLIFYEPIGVVGIITPWNYPLLTLSERLPFCLAAGCAALVKTSEYTPAFSKILSNLINKDIILSKKIKIIEKNNKKIGKAICKDKNISMISFVGSSLTGKKIMKQSSGTLKKLSLELGGKNPAIICSSANLNIAVQKIINGIFENGGQACVGISRVIIHEEIYNKFLKLLISRVEKLILQKKLNSQIPSTNFQKQKVNKIMNLIKKNYKKDLIRVFKNKSKVYTPIFLRSFKNKKFFNSNEFFFPIVTFEKFKNIDECCNSANQSDQRLAAYIFSSNIMERIKITKKLNFGRIWWNSSLEWSPNLPVGGFGSSGLGRDMGSEGFKNYLISKNVFINNIGKND